MRPDLGQDVSGLKGGGGGLISLVPGTAPCPIKSLLHRIHRQHSKTDW